MPKHPQPVCYKTLFQVGFAGSMKYAARVNEAAAGIEGFTNWKLGPGRVACQDFLGVSSIVVEGFRVTFDQDRGKGAVDVGIEETRISQVMATAERLGVEKFSRFGYRKKYLVNLNQLGIQYDGLVKMVELKYNNQSDTLKSLVPPILDISYRVDCKEDDYRYKIHLGPMKKEQVETFIEFDSELHLDPEKRSLDYAEILVSYPEVSIFMDFDISIVSENSTMKPSLMLEFKEFASKKFNELSNGLTKYTLDLED